MKVTSVSALLFVFIAFLNSTIAQNTDTASLLADVTSSDRVLLPESFVFHKSLCISYSTESKSEHTDLKYKIRYPNCQSYMAMTIAGLVEDTAAKRPEIVVDFKQQRIINFMCFSDTKMALIHTLTESKKDVSILKTNFGFIKATGKKKEILNYACAEYAFELDGTEGKVWLTEAIDKNLEEPFAALGLKIPASDTTPNRYVIRYEAHDKATKEVSKLSINKLNLEDTYSIDAQKYVASFIPGR